MKKNRVFCILLILSLIVSSGCGDAPASVEVETAAIRIEEKKEPEVEGIKTDSYDETEQLSVEANESSSESIETEPEFLLSDGPIFCTQINKSPVILSFYLYSMKTGEKHEMFRLEYDISTPEKMYVTSADFITSFGHNTNTLNYERAFDSGMQRLLLSWLDNTNRSWHIGWIDKQGNITDVTNLIHPATSDFSSVIPKDFEPIFTADDLIMFYNGNDDRIDYYDTKDNKIVGSDERTVEITEGLGPTNTIGPDNKYLGRDYFISDEKRYDITGRIHDFLQVGNDFVFLSVFDGYICHYGPTVSPLYTSPSGDQYYADSTFNGFEDECTVKITPDSDYDIEQLAYSNGEIAFTAKRGEERALFKMSYVDGVAGTPELVETIDDSWGRMLFWKDDVLPVENSESDAVEIRSDNAADIGTEQELNSNESEKDYKTIKNFKIEGTWRNIGTGTYGQMQTNAAVVFNGANCNVYSPVDTYAFYQEGDNYVLNCTSVLGETIVFSVGIVDKNRIDIIKGSTVVELERVNE